LGVLFKDYQREMNDEIKKMGYNTMRMDLCVVGLDVVLSHVQDMLGFRKNFKK
jgi:hypothetical protein